jgi:protein TonB
VDIVGGIEEVEEVTTAKETKTEAPRTPQMAMTPEKAPDKPTAPVEAPTAPVKTTEGPKPVVKFVKKKLTLVPEGTPTPQTVQPSSVAVGPGPAAPTMAPAPPPEPRKDDVRPTPPEQAATVKPEKKEDKAAPGPTDEEKAARKIEANEAFKRIQLVHKAATAMHNKGKDVGQIFELLKYAEEARKKGDLKAYTGVSKQLESMLLSMQTKK